jgi:hypothetical protein
MLGELEHGRRQMKHTLSDRKSGLRLVQSGLAVTMVLGGFSIGKLKQTKAAFHIGFPGASAARATVTGR